MYVSANRVKRGTKNMTIDRFRQFINWYIQHNTEEEEKVSQGTIAHDEKQLYHTISRTTAHYWLTKYLGFKYLNLKKGIYKDGHERSDVVEDRVQYVAFMMQVAPRLVKIKREMLTNPFDGKPVERVSFIEPTIPEGTKLVVRIWQDECIIRCGDAQSYAWTNPGYEYGVPKSVV